MWIAIFIWFILTTPSLAPSRDANFFRHSRTDSSRPSSLNWRNSEASNRRGGEYTSWWSFIWNAPRLWPDVVVTFMTETICSDSIKSRSEKYLLWKARTSWSKRIRSFLIRLFSFLTAPFMLARTVRFYDAAFDLPNTFFLFLQHVFIPKFVWRCRP